MIEPIERDFMTLIRGVGLLARNMAVPLENVTINTNDGIMYFEVRTHPGVSVIETARRMELFGRNAPDASQRLSTGHFCMDYEVAESVFLRILVEE